MTVTYTADVATAKFACFLTLLTRWRGSIYKLLWKDFVIFAFVYFTLQCLYRFVLGGEQKRIFEMIARYCADNNSRIPVAFVLGFYVSLVMSRWWGALTMIPWPDHMAMFVTANVRGLDERGRLMRRTMLRYICLAYTITMASISPPVRKRFPTMQHFVDSGLMTPNEMVILEKLRTPHNKFFIPLGWTTTLVSRARTEGRIKDDFAVKTLNDEINEFRRHLATLFVYDMVTIPLVYTQVVTIAVYMFFLACLMGRQFLTDDPTKLDLYFPVFTFLEYFFYMGWLKVAECLINPFGEDDDDFDINFLIDRNLQVAYMIVDEMHDEHPELIRDQYWDDTLCEMPYTEASAAYKQKQLFKGSASDMRVLGSNMVLSTMEAIDECDDDDNDDDPDDIFVQEEMGRVKGGNSPRRVPLLPPKTKMSAGSAPVSRMYSRSDSKSQQHSPPQHQLSGREFAKHNARGRKHESVSSRLSKRSDEMQFSMDPVNADVDDIVARLEEGIETNIDQPSSSYNSQAHTPGSRDGVPMHRNTSTASTGVAAYHGLSAQLSGSSGTASPGQAANQQTGSSSAAPLLLSQPLNLTQSDFALEERDRQGLSATNVPTAAVRTSIVSPTDDEMGGQKSYSLSDAEYGRQSSNLSTASSASTVREMPKTQQATVTSGTRPQQAAPSLTLYKLSDGDDEELEDGDRRPVSGSSSNEKRSSQGGPSSGAWSPGKNRYNRAYRPPESPGTPLSATPKSPVWVQAEAGGTTTTTKDSDRARLPSVPL